MEKIKRPPQEPTNHEDNSEVKTIYQSPFNDFNKKRIITTTKKWISVQNYNIINQLEIITKIHNTMTNLNRVDDEVAATIDKLIIQQIKQKMSSYKHQDQLKGIYDYDNSINSVEYILSLLVQCQLNCFYCTNKVNVIYEKVCESTQWTLERIDNNIGHNYDNVCIACLKCNIRRRTMHQKRYIFTKKCTVVELEDHY